MTRSEVIARAIEAGATVAEIDKEAELQRRHVGTVPFRHMIKALQMHAWQNTRTDWIRLAGAMSAKAKRA